VTAPAYLVLFMVVMLALGCVRVGTVSLEVAVDRCPWASVIRMIDVKSSPKRASTLPSHHMSPKPQHNTTALISFTHLHYDFRKDVFVLAVPGPTGKAATTRH